MRKETFVNAEAQRSVNEPMALVFNPSFNIADQEAEKSPQKKDGKKKRSLSSVAKSKIVALYKRSMWNANTPEEKQVLFKKCVTKVLNDMEGYNELAFKKDIAMRMALLLNERHFQQDCFEAGWSLFEVSQLLCWTNQRVFQAIRDYGINHVQGFNTPGILVYEMTDLEQDLRALGFDQNYFKDDPYTVKWKALHPDVKEPVLPKPVGEAEQQEGQDAQQNAEVEKAA